MEYIDMKVSKRHYEAIWAWAEKNNAYVGDTLYCLLEEILMDAAKRDEQVKRIIETDPEDF